MKLAGVGAPASFIYHGTQLVSLLKNLVALEKIRGFWRFF
ncbi:MAG: hypothetical protein BWZ10_01484 [candidate division BRC1 bacterium ADurb.BinA364]|nr:MAG: hypothetical protein BWZ10_01484 [candidate division BRC1 bacterium ADurb.BinA364]